LLDFAFVAIMTGQYWACVLEVTIRVVILVISVLGKRK